MRRWLVVPLLLIAALGIGFLARSAFVSQGVGRRALAMSLAQLFRRFGIHTDLTALKGINQLENARGETKLRCKPGRAATPSR